MFEVDHVDAPGSCERNGCRSVRVISSILLIRKGGRSLRGYHGPIEIEHIIRYYGDVGDGCIGQIVSTMSA
jgi:hypothetical protein